MVTVTNVPKLKYCVVKHNNRKHQKMFCSGTIYSLTIYSKVLAIYVQQLVK